MDIALNASSHVNVEVIETQGLFTTSITQTEEIVVLDANGKEVSKIKDTKIGNKLSTSGSAGLWALCDGCYEIIGIMGMIMVEKDERKDEFLLQQRPPCWAVLPWLPRVHWLPL
jgi:hypothetical protein